MPICWPNKARNELGEAGDGCASRSPPDVGALGGVEGVGIVGLKSTEEGCIGGLCLQHQQKESWGT